VSVAPYGRALPSADALARRSIALRAAALGALVLGSFAYGVATIATDGSAYLLIPFAAGLVVLALLMWPRLGIYWLFAAALLLEEWGIAGIEPITGQLHFFQNVSGYTSIPLRFSVADMLCVLTLVAWLLRRAVGANAPARMGPLGWPILALATLFGTGIVVGVARGGDWNMNAALAELRGPLYLCLTYFLSVNLIRSRRDVTILMRLLVVLIAVKAAQGLGNYIEMANGPIWLEAVTAHEDVVFFDLALALAIGAFVLKLRGRLVMALYAASPIVMATELVTQRRVAFIALAAAFVTLAILLAAAERRRTLILFGTASVCLLFYAVIAWDQQGLLAQPIRALKGSIDPSSLSARDLSSNWWRELENLNISYTLRQLPLTGVGLGQQYLFLREPAELSNFIYWRYMTHDAVLWIWLKTGALGFLAFWALVAQTAVVGASLFRRLRSPDMKLVALLPVLLIAIQVVFSSVDLGLTYSRTMIVLGVSLGLTAYLTDAARAQEAGVRPQEAAA
jgi:hypothetical protein